LLFNHDRALDIMERFQLDALIACNFENVFYTSSLAWTPWSIGIHGEWNFTFSVIPFENEKEATLIVPKIVDAWPLLMQSDRSWIRDVRYYGENWFQTASSKMSRLEETFVERMAAKSSRDPIATLAEVIMEKGLGKGSIGIEKDSLNFSGESREFIRLQRLLPSAKFVEASPVLRRIRLVKSPDEVERLEEALRVNERALRVAFESIRNGNETSVARAAAKAITERGGLPLSVGVRHSHSSNAAGGKRFKRGDLVWNDYLISYLGYCSDAARMASVGKADAEPSQVCAKLAGALGEIIELARPGVRVVNLYDEAISLIAERVPYPHGEFGPCLGHGIGVCLGNRLGVGPHEEPWVVATSDSVLEPGMVINLEVPYNCVGLGVFNIEDTIQITQRGNKRLSKLPRGAHVA